MMDDLILGVNYRVKESNLFVDKECVGHPDEADVLGPHNQLVDPEVHRVEGEPGVGPELAEVHVEREVHVLKYQTSCQKSKFRFESK